MSGLTLIGSVKTPALLSDGSIKDGLLANISGKVSSASHRTYG